MTAEFIAILAVGVALAGLNFRLAWLLNRRIGRFEDRLVAFGQRTEDRFAAVERGMAELRERMARLEGPLEGLRESIGQAA